MARGFSTKGVSTTDIVTTTDTDGCPTLATWSIWAYAFSSGGGSLGKWMTIASATGVGNDFAFGINSSSAAGTVSFLMPNGTGGESKWHITVNGGSNPPWTQYHHFCTTMDFSAINHVPVMYYDGVSQSVTQDAAASDVSQQLAGRALSIGNRATDSLRVFDGYLADAAVWNVILTAAEVAALAAGARPYQIRPTALKGWWPLDGLQSPEPDLSGRAHGGTLTGTAIAPGPPFMPLTRRIPFSEIPVAIPDTFANVPQLVMI